MRYTSPKHNFLTRGSDQDEYDNLIRVQKTEYRPGPMAQKVHMSFARTRIMRGGLGSGKTRCAGEHINQICLKYPGALCVVGRRDSTVLKETTQKEYLEKVVAPETIDTFNVNENKLYYKNGSAVIFRDAKDPDNFKSLEITAYLIDEADENPDEQLWFKLDQRLRQKIYMNGEWVKPLYAGLLVLNPTDEEHWLYHLSLRTDISVEDFQFSTFDNIENLPDDYIPNLIASLPPWEISRLVYGNWGRQVKGKPVLHGFTFENNVRSLKVREDLIMLRGWDWGFNHPAVSWLQIDPKYGRVFKLRELVGSKIYLPEFVKEVKAVHNALCGPDYPTLDYGDPHGADKKDVGPSSIEYLRLHHGITVNYRRQRVVTGLDEIQEKILAKKPVDPDHPNRLESCFLVDLSCKVSIGAYSGGYHRDEEGNPVKDGFYDHVVDTDRYPIVHNMNPVLAARRRQKKTYIPRNVHTGY